jgi:hypothetical protein
VARLPCPYSEPHPLTLSKSICLPTEFCRAEAQTTDLTKSWRSSVVTLVWPMKNIPWSRKFLSPLGFPNPESVGVFPYRDIRANWQREDHAIEIAALLLPPTHPAWGREPQRRSIAWQIRSLRHCCSTNARSMALGEVESCSAFFARETRAGNMWRGAVNCSTARVRKSFASPNQSKIQRLL